MSSGTERVERKLAAIFCADVADYSRLMHADEPGTMRTLAAYREIMDGLISQHDGRIANTAGDSVLVEFPSVVDAVECAVAVQEKLGAANAGVPDDRALRFRIGVHVGDVMVRGGDLLGDGVNIAARVQGLAEPGGVWITSRAYEEVEGKVGCAFEDRGEQQVKNIARPLRVFAVAGHNPRMARAEASASPRPSIAVLPFDNMSGAPEDEYFSDGITEEIITALTRMRWFHVVARNSVFGYKGRAQDIRQVARDLGASYVLEGSVRKLGARLRLTAQLIDGVTGNHVWAKRYDRELHDIFAVQDDLTESIVASVEPELGKAERERAKSKRVGSLSAWDLCQRASWHIYRRTRDDLTEAARLFQASLDLDPTLLPALTGLAEVHYFMIVFGYADGDPATHRHETMRLARRAMELDDQDPSAYCALARAHLAYNEHESAVPLLQSALSLNPSLAYAHYLLGVARSYSGAALEGLRHFDDAIKLSPFDVYMGRFLACKAEAYLFLGEYDEAVRWARDAIRQPTLVHWSGFATLAAALGHLGRMSEASNALSKLLRNTPHFSAAVLTSIALRDPASAARYLEGLRLAGLPE